MNDPAVSIIIRSFNEAWALRETLPAVQAQEYKNLGIDCASIPVQPDGSQEIIHRAKPRASFIRVAPEEYNPSRVMNHGMQLARSEFGIF